MNVREVTIALGGNEDAPEIARLIHESFREYEGQLKPPSAALNETPESIVEEFNVGTFAILARIEGIPVGCVLATPRDRDVYFGRLSVVPAHRRHGVAQLLIAELEHQAVNRGFEGVLLAVRISLTENQRFFRDLGYIEITRRAHPGFSEPTAIDMRKALQH